MAPSAAAAAAATASPLSRLLLSLPNPSVKLPVSSPSRNAGAAVAAKNSTPVVALRRREAVAAVLSAAILSRVLPAAAEASGGECPLEVAPNGLAFCDRVVGTGAAAEQGQLIKVSTTARTCQPTGRRRRGEVSGFLLTSPCVSFVPRRRITPGGWRTARCSTAATSAGSRSPSASASAR